MFRMMKTTKQYRCPQYMARKSLGPKLNKMNKGYGINISLVFIVYYCMCETFVHLTLLLERKTGRMSAVVRKKNLGYSQL